MSSDRDNQAGSVSSTAAVATDVKSFVSSDYNSEHFEAYRALSKAAVVSAGLSMVGLLGFLFAQLLILPVLGFIFALIAFVNLRRYRNELTGKGMAVTGIVLSVVTVIFGSSIHAYVYATEVPDGYERVNWYELRGQESQPVNLFAMQIRDKPIFIKGYVHPGVEGFGEVKSFVLVPDMKTCCFGGQPKPWDMIEITLAENCSKVKYSRHKRGLWGVFRVGPAAGKKIGTVRPGFYQMTAEDLR